MDGNIKDKQIKKMLAEFLGVDESEINDDDSLRDDLHINAPELTDFIERLKVKKIIDSDINLTNIETVSDLIDEISSNDI